MLGLKSNISAHVLTKSWFQILIALKSMRCRGASLQLIMAGSKSYIPTGIFAKTPFQILIDCNQWEWDSVSIKILLIPLASKRVQRDAIYRKMESSKLSQSKRNLKLTRIAKSTNSNLLLPTPPPTLRRYCQFVILSSKSNKSPRVFTKTRFQISIAYCSCDRLH